MGNKKFIVTAAILAMLFIGYNVADANNSNNLTQIDVKKSSATDTVDVTLYTTDTNTNTVVTRKGNNRYVVLLPNVSSNSSVTPSISGLKDMISNVEVKHIDDGIGGYTKVTFETTKPITIKTHNKKSTQLTQAQKDSQAIIAKNNTKPAVSQTSKTQITEKPVSNTTTKPAATAQSKPVAATQPKPAANTTKPQQPAKTVSIPKLIPIEIPKISLVKKPDVSTKPVTQPNAQATVKPKTVEQPKVYPKVAEQPKAKPVVKSETNDFLNSNYKPQMKFDENGKRMIDLEPRVSHSTGTESPVSDAVSLNENTVQAQPQLQPKIVENELQNKENNHKGFPWWILLAGGTVVGGGLLYLVFDAIRHSNEKDASRLESFFSLSTQNQAKRRRREYYDIVNDSSLNWQEKYKRYVEKESQNAPQKGVEDASFVTNIGANKSTLVMPKLEEDIKPKSSDELAQTIKKPEKSHNEIIREKLQAKISQMEHSLAQTPSLKEPEEISHEVKSEDNAIIKKISDVKLKSFAKPKTLKQTQRALLEDNTKPENNEIYKEGQYVKLNDSSLSVSKRPSASTEINHSTENKYLTNNGEMKMNKENENYLVSSLGEYMSILDAEEKRKSEMSLTEALSQVRARGEVTRGATNPISGSNERPIRGINSGLVVKSGYSIDSERGIYLVNIDGASALIGRIKGNTFMLKKFDKVIDKQLQVRPESDNVYIVRAGNFKCLVDVTSDKMGTLIEI